MDTGASDPSYSGHVSPADPPADSRHVTSSPITFSNYVQSCTHHQNQDAGTQKAYLCHFAAGPFPHPWSQETTTVLSIPPVLSFLEFRGTKSCSLLYLTTFN